MPRMVLERGRIVIQGNTYAIKDELKQIPGWQWSPIRKVWHYPPVGSIALRLAEQFPKWLMDDHVRRLVRLGQEVRDAHFMKTCPIEDLGSIKGARKPPWAHQVRAFWFAHQCRNALLALDMGTGKTAVAIHLITNLGLKRVLVSCPNAVVPVWPHQFEEHTDIPVNVVPLTGHVVDRLQLAKWWFEREITQPLVLVTNHEAVWMKPLGPWIKEQQWDLVIVDESHRAKAPGGTLSKFLTGIRDRAARRLCLTGTPMPHSPLDIYAQYRFLDPGIFGTSYTRFRARYAIMGGFENKQVLDFQNQDELHERMFQIAYRVTSDEVLDLPEMVFTDQLVELDPPERKLYEEIKEELVADYRTGTITASNALVKILRLSQVANGHVGMDEGPVEIVGSSKLHALAELVEGIRADEPIVIFARFLPDIARIKETIEGLGREVFEFRGEVKELDEWREACKLADPQEESAPVLVAQIQSGSEGIDLTEARYCIYFSLGYNLGNYTQSLKRVHRPGQTRTTFFYHLLAQRTIDTVIKRSLMKKGDVVESVLNYFAGGDHE